MSRAQYEVEVALLSNEYSNRTCYGGTLLSDDGEGTTALILSHSRCHTEIVP